MGIGSSRQRGNIQHAPRHHGGGRRRKRGYIRARKPATTALPLVPTITQPFYTFNYPFAAIPGYGRVRPMPSPYLPISYNNYPIPSPYLMMRPPQLSASPYGAQMPIQPVYNNPAFASPAPVGNPYYPSVPPARLLTDWTGGGKISPGFLGPPL